MNSELEQIDTDLQIHLLTRLKKMILDYHTAAAIAKIPAQAQLATIFSTIQCLFVKMAVEAHVDKEHVLEAISDSYDRLLEGRDQ
jgi:hypothetical protein